MIKVLLADDHHLVRQGLRQLLEKDREIQVIAEAANGEDAIDAVDRLRPDVVVMDVEMPGINGIEATKRIRASYPAIQVVMLSMYSDSALVRQALQNGARSYVLKRSVGTELVKAIRTVCGGVIYYSQAVEQAGYAYGHQPEDTISRLSPREREVLQLIAMGQTNRQIAATLHISIKTVEKHRTSLMAKLNTHSLPDLIRAAIKLGLIGLTE